MVLFSGCPNTGSGTSPIAGGTVTVRLLNAAGMAAVSGDDLYAILYAQNEHSINTESRVLAINSVNIPGDTAELTLEEESTAAGDWMPNGTNWIGSGGTSYDLYLYTDDNNDGDSEPATGAANSSNRTDPFVTTVTINGNQIVTVDASDLIDYTGGMLIVEISGAASVVGNDLMAEVYLQGANRSSDDPLGSGYVNLDVSAKTFTLEYDGNIDGSGYFYGVDGLSYDLYIYIDMDGSQTPNTGDKKYTPWPVTYTQSGDKTEDTDYATDYTNY